MSTDSSHSFPAAASSYAYAACPGVSALVPDLWVPVAVVTAVAFLVVLVRGNRRMSLVWARKPG